MWILLTITDQNTAAALAKIQSRLLRPSNLMRLRATDAAIKLRASRRYSVTPLAYREKLITSHQLEISQRKLRSPMVYLPMFEQLC
jgi:hypothetical protein